MAKNTAPSLLKSGETPGGLPVIRGVFYYHSTVGLPLTDILDVMSRKKQVVDWADFVAGARKDGWSWRTIKSKISESTANVYGREYAQEVRNRLDLLEAIA